MVQWRLVARNILRERAFQEFARNGRLSLDTDEDKSAAIRIWLESLRLKEAAAIKGFASGEATPVTVQPTLKVVQRW